MSCLSLPSGQHQIKNCDEKWFNEFSEIKIQIDSILYTLPPSSFLNRYASSEVCLFSIIEVFDDIKWVLGGPFLVQYY